MHTHTIANYNIVPHVFPHYIAHSLIYCGSAPLFIHHISYLCVSKLTKQYQGASSCLLVVVSYYSGLHLKTLHKKYYLYDKQAGTMF